MSSDTCKPKELTISKIRSPFAQNIKNYLLICLLNCTFAAAKRCKKTITKRQSTGLSLLKRRGKSGQHRASRFLTGRGSRGSDSAEENNRLERGKGEKVGQEPTRSAVMSMLCTPRVESSCKPAKLCLAQVNRERGRPVRAGG